MDVHDYVLVIQDDSGAEVARIVQSAGSLPPKPGDETPLDLADVKDTPELAGRYIVERVVHLPAPSRTSTRRRYKIPHCFVRRLASVPAEPQRKSSDVLDEATAAEVARRNRDLATDLDDVADELALAVHRVGPATIDPKLVDRLNDASRRAKQVAFTAIFKSKAPGEPK